MVRKLLAWHKWNGFVFQREIMPEIEKTVACCWKMVEGTPKPAMRLHSGTAGQLRFYFLA
jgi:hypothetical protein